MRSHRPISSRRMVWWATPGKYPKAVKKVKDPQQAWFDDMMSKAKEDGAVGDDDLPATYSTEDADAGGEDDGEVHDLDAAGSDEL